MDEHMVSDASNTKRDYISEWIGAWAATAHPDDFSAKEYRERRLRELSDPDFGNADRVHDWRNYVGDAMQGIWHTFTDEQKAAIALNADELAGREDWD